MGRPAGEHVGDEDRLVRLGSLERDGEGFWPSGGTWGASWVVSTGVVIDVSVQLRCNANIGHLTILGVRRSVRTMKPVATGSRGEDNAATAWQPRRRSVEGCPGRVRRRARRQHVTPEALEGMGEALWWIGDPTGVRRLSHPCVTPAYRRDGNDVRGRRGRAAVGRRLHLQPRQRRRRPGWAGTCRESGRGPMTGIFARGTTSAWLHQRQTFGWPSTRRAARSRTVAVNRTAISSCVRCAIWAWHWSGRHRDGRACPHRRRHGWHPRRRVHPARHRRVHLLRHARGL